MHVKNFDELVDHGNTELRKELLRAVEVALEEVDPYRLTKNIVRIENGRLMVRDLQFDLNHVGRVFVVGAGKATYPIAKALEEILEGRIADGLIIVREDEIRTLSRIRVVRAGHPMPNQSGYEAAQEIVKMASNRDKDDLFFAAFTGGCSALMPYPTQGVSLEDKREVTRLLLGSGATIREINAVRKHLSRTKGGGLARIMAPATVVNLTVSDVIGDPLDCITDPTVVDFSTFADAIDALEKYDVWDKVAPSVRNRLAKGTPELETLKDYGYLRVHNFILANNVMAAEAARHYFEARGFNSEILSTSLEGESREVGLVLASIALETVQYNRPVKKPAAYVFAGETLVKLEESMLREGMGGPSQELAVAVALRLPGNSRIAGIFLDTDGSDGPTAYAGALVDSETATRAEFLHVDLYESLKRHEISPALRKLSDAIITGPTGKNVMDLAIVAIQ